jgi:glycosyltransferase involved in cell wall biosynthesis
MHIMIAAPEIGRQWGGIGTYLHELLDGLAPRTEITILGGGVPATPIAAARVVPIVQGRDIMMTYARFQMAFRRRLPDLVRDYRPDLVLANHAQMPDLLVPHRKRGPPFVTIAHTTIQGQVSATRRALRDGGGPMDRSERVTLAASAALLPAEVYYWHYVRNAVFVSEAVQDEVRQISTVHLGLTATVPNGLNFDELRRLAEGGGGDTVKKEATIFYAGRMLSSKGLAVLFRALCQLPPDGWSLRLAGVGDAVAWKRYAHSLGLPEARVEFLGGLPRPRVLELLRHMDIFVLPSYYESCPFSLLEAMGLAVPCIATSLPTIRRMVVDQESALLTPPGDATALARALRTLLEDPDFATRIGASGRRIAEERFTARRMCEDTAHLFERVLSAA